MVKTVLLRVTAPDEVGEEPEYIVNLAMEHLLGNDYGVVTSANEHPDVDPEQVIVVEPVIAGLVLPRPT